MDILQEIKKIDLFQGVSSDKLQILAGQAVYKKYAAQEMIIGETDAIKSFYIVLTGRLKLYKSSPEGKEQTIQLLGPGEPFGLCTAFATDAFPASAMAIEERRNSDPRHSHRDRGSTGTKIVAQHHSNFIPTAQGFHGLDRIAGFRRNPCQTRVISTAFAVSTARRRQATGYVYNATRVGQNSGGHPGSAFPRIT